MSVYTPPFCFTNNLVNLIADICEISATLSCLHQDRLTLQQKRLFKARSLRSTLAIEQNHLSLEEISAILDGKRVFGHPVEILEVKNASVAYDNRLSFSPLSVDDVLKAHKLMMNELVTGFGHFRTTGVGVFAGTKLIHMAPPAQKVPELIADLIEWYKSSDFHPLVKSAIFHYEFEYIHPFADGNGRIGRMWHSLLLGKWKNIFYYLPVEELILKRQAEYYKALSNATAMTDSACFVEYILEVIKETLVSFADSTNTDQVTDHVTDQVTNHVTDQVADQVADQVSAKLKAFEKLSYVEKLIYVLGNDTLSLKELMEKLHLSHKPTFRHNYLMPALEQHLIEMTIPDKPKSRLQKYRKTKVKA